MNERQRRLQWLICTLQARERAVAATAEARFYAGRVRLLVSHPAGSWPRSPQFPPAITRDRRT